MSGEPNDNMPLGLRNDAEGGCLHATGTVLTLHINAVAGSSSLAKNVLPWICYEL